MSSGIVLCVERSEAIRTLWREALLRAGFSVLTAAGLEDIARLAAPQQIVLAVAGSSGEDAAGLIQSLHFHLPRVPVIFSAANNTVDAAIEAFRAGAADYLLPPVQPEVLVNAVQRTLGRAGGVTRTSASLDGAVGLDAMVGESPIMRDVKGTILRFAPTDSNVLITGESGTGKELAARAIHSHSNRKGKPFVVINCAAVPDTLVESELFGHEKGSFTGADGLQHGKLHMANGGTVLFDEIGDMSPYAQTKILRLVETKEIQRLGTSIPSRLDIRILAATNQNLEKLSEEGRFRRDLYFRLNVVRLHMPPLRDRPGDVPLLLEHALAAWNRKTGQTVHGFGDEATRRLLSYDWPGNVREFNNLMETSFAGCDAGRVSLDRLPKLFEKLAESPEAISASERDRLISVLTSCNWNKSRAAQKLHWSRMTLYRKLAKHHLAKRAC